MNLAALKQGLGLRALLSRLLVGFGLRPVQGLGFLATFGTFQGLSM